MEDGKWRTSERLIGMSLKGLKIPAKDRWRGKALIQSTETETDANDGTLRCSVILLYFCMIPTP